MTTLAAVDDQWVNRDVINIRGGSVILTSGMIRKTEMGEAGEIK